MAFFLELLDDEFTSVLQQPGMKGDAKLVHAWPKPCKIVWGYCRLFSWFNSVLNSLNWKIEAFQTKEKDLKRFLYCSVTVSQSNCRIHLAAISHDLNGLFWYFACKWHPRKKRTDTQTLFYIVRGSQAFPSLCKVPRGGFDYTIKLVVLTIMLTHIFQRNRNILNLFLFVVLIKLSHTMGIVYLWYPPKLIDGFIWYFDSDKYLKYPLRKYWSFSQF